MNEPAVVISGASTGIGRACALQLDGLGFRVFAGVRRNSDGEVLRAVASPRLEPIILDITDSEHIAVALRRVRIATADSGLAGLVNNAGVAVGGPIEYVPIDHFRTQFEVNVFGQVAMTQAFLPLLRQSQGRVVNISSVAGKLAQPLFGPYCASKHALEALTDALRVELRPWRIAVSLIEPGSVRTPIWEKGTAAGEALIAEMPAEARRLYGAAGAAALALAAQIGARGVPPERVAAAVVHALTARRPHTRYVVGRDARVGIMLARLLSDRLRDRVLARMFGMPGDATSTGLDPAESETRVGVGT